MINDQAQNLRDFVNNSKTMSKTQNKDAKIYCISSGKGGVGKSNFTANMALSLKNKGKKVLVIDADFGLANVEILMGVVAKYNFLDFVNDDLNIKDIITQTDDNIMLISAGSGILELANMSEAKLNKIVNSIMYIKEFADIILIDTGAGITKDVTAFTHIASEVIVVTTAEPTSVADAYALVKVINKNNPGKIINMVINKVESQQEADSVFNNINTVSTRFIGRKLNYLGYIYFDMNLIRAVKKQEILLKFDSRSKAARCIDSISDKLIDESVYTENFSTFVDRFKSLFR